MRRMTNATSLRSRLQPEEAEDGEHGNECERPHAERRVVRLPRRIPFCLRGHAVERYERDVSLGRRCIREPLDVQRSAERGGVPEVFRLGALQLDRVDDTVAGAEGKAVIVGSLVSMNV